jgi:4-carboxymuconolactone decarboxylase
MAKLPRQYRYIRDSFTEYHEALSNLGKASRAAGPLEEKTSQLVQLAAAAAIRSEGAVHSHARRAMEAGARPEELYHTLLLLTCTIGFPTVSAAISWIDDVLEKDVQAED